MQTHLAGFAGKAATQSSRPAGANPALAIDGKLSTATFTLPEVRACSAQCAVTAAVNYASAQSAHMSGPRRILGGKRRSSLLVRRKPPHLQVECTETLLLNPGSLTAPAARAPADQRLAPDRPGLGGRGDQRHH